MSLRGRILALAVGSAAAMLVLLAIPVVVTVRGNVQQDARQTTVSVARGVADLVSTGRADTDELAAVVDRANARAESTQVTIAFSDGSRIGATDPSCSVTDGTADFSPLPETESTTPEHRDDDGDDRGPRGVGRVSEVELAHVDGGQLIRVVAHPDETGESDVAVCALLPDSDLREEVAERVGVLALAGTVTLIAVAALAAVVGRRLAGHLTATAATADRLAEGDLDARAPEDGPVEVRRVGAALNRLATRIDELLTLERETVADLSHRLRTPLTALRLDVEALPSSEAKQEFEDHLGQLERTLTAVIQTARRPQREGAAPHADAAVVVGERFAFWSALMEDQGREAALHLDLPTGHRPVRCSPEDLAVALDALLENAVAHTAEGVPVAVVVAPAPDGGVVLDVRDGGPGVPPAALRRGVSDRGSTGLGLDIARSVAAATGGSLELATEHGWSVVRLRLGPA